MAVILLFVPVYFLLISSALGNTELHHEEHALPSSGVESDLYCDRDYSCLNCSAVRVCAPTLDGQNLREIDRFTCGSSNPYCNYTSGSCSSTPDPFCYNNPNTTISTNFTCMRDGYYPDPYNCSLYYHCQDEVPYQYTCTYPNSYYHPGSKTCVTNNYYCVDRTTSYYCRYSNYLGRKVPIYYSSNLFLYCGVNGEVLTVDRCIGAYYFDQSAQLCIPSCPNAGLFPKIDDCANYYKCSPKPYDPNGGFVMTNMTCPEGQGYLESDYSCVNRSHVPNCYARYPDLYSK